MKLNQLRKIIREEVRSAIKDELADILSEAVEIASRPNEVNEAKAVTPTYTRKPITPPTIKTGNSALDAIFEDTAKSMTGEDAVNILGSTQQQKPSMASSVHSNLMAETAGPMPGIDISKLSFVKNASAILKASEDKDKERHP